MEQVMDVTGEPEKVFRILVKVARESTDTFTVSPILTDGLVTGFRIAGELDAVTHALRYRKGVTKHNR